MPPCLLPIEYTPASKTRLSHGGKTTATGSNTHPSQIFSPKKLKTAVCHGGCHGNLGLPGVPYRPRSANYLPDALTLLFREENKRKCHIRSL